MMDKDLIRIIDLLEEIIQANPRDPVTNRLADIQTELEDRVGKIIAQRQFQEARVRRAERVTPTPPTQGIITP